MPTLDLSDIEDPGFSYSTSNDSTSPSATGGLTLSAIDLGEAAPNGNPYPSPESVAAGQARAGGTYPGANQADQPSPTASTSFLGELFPKGEQLSQQIAADTAQGGYKPSLETIPERAIGGAAAGFQNAAHAFGLPSPLNIVPWAQVDNISPSFQDSSDLSKNASAPVRILHDVASGAGELALETPLFVATGPAGALVGETAGAAGKAVISAEQLAKPWIAKTAQVLSRIADDSTNLAAFSGLTAPDNERAKAAAQGAEFGTALALAGLPAATLGQKVTEATGSALAGDIAARTAKVLTSGGAAAGLSVAQGGDAEEAAKNALMVAIPGLAEGTPLDLQAAFERRNEAVSNLTKNEHQKAVSAAAVSDATAKIRLAADLATSQTDIEQKAQQVDQSRDAIRQSVQSILDTTPQVIALQDKIAQAKQRQMSAATIKTFTKQLVDLKKQRQKMADAHENLLDQHDDCVAQLADAAQKRDDAITPVILNHPAHAEPTGEPDPAQRANVNRLVQEGQGIFERTGDSTVLESAQRQQRALDDQMIRAHKIEQDASDAEQRKFEAQRQADAEASRIESQGRTAPLPGEVPPEAQGAFEAQQNADVVNHNPEDAARQNLRQNQSLENTPISDVQAASEQRLRNNSDAAYQRQAAVADRHLAALRAERMAPVIKALADTAVSEARAGRDATVHARTLGLDEKTSQEVGDIARQQARIEALGKRVQDQQNARDFEGAIQTEREYNATLDRAMQKANAATARTRAEANASPSEKLVKQRGLSKLTDAERAEYDTAQKEIGKKIAEGLYANPAGIIFDPKTVKNLAIIGKSLFKNGYRTFRDFSKKMIDDYGVGVKPHLKAIWKEVSENAIPGVKATAPVGKSDKILTTGGIKLPTSVLDKLKSFAPEARSIEAGKAATIGRSAIAERNNDVIRASKLLTKDKVIPLQNGKKGTFDKFFSQFTPDERLDMIDRYERGLPEKVPGVSQFFDAAKRLEGSLWQEVRAETGITTDIPNYFSHKFTDEAAGAQLSDEFRNSRGPFAGDAAFLKKREYPTIKEALAANPNLKLRYDNPVDVVMHNVASLSKWLTAHDMVSQMDADGLSVPVGKGEKAPDGWRPLPDSVKVSQDGKVRYAPPEVTQLIENYLAPGFGNWFDQARKATGLLTSAQLGLSGYHLFLTAGQSNIIQAADALNPTGGLRLKQRAQQLGRAMAVGLGTGLTLKKGAEGRQVAIADKNSPQAILFDLAGARISPDSSFEKEAAKGLSASFKALTGADSTLGQRVAGLGGTALHGATVAHSPIRKAIMDWWVPNLKAGLLMYEGQKQYDALPPRLKAIFDGGRDAIRKASPEDRAALAKPLQAAWDKIDARLGEVQYERYFLDPHIKQLGQLAMRAPGFNIGTLSTVLPLAVKDGRITVADSQRVSQFIVGSLLHAAAGGLIGYALTGKKPKELADYIAPKTGKKNPDGSDQRLALPGYDKDYQSAHEHPIDTILNKLNPAMGLASSELFNKQYDGTMVRNPDDPALTQVKQSLAYAGKSLLPFSVHGQQRLAQAGASPNEQALSYAGFSPAPKAFGQTDAEKFASNFLANNRANARTPETAELQNEISQARREAQRGNVTNQNKLIAAGLMSKKTAAVPGMPLPNSIDLALHEMTPSDASELQAKMNPIESAKYLPVIQKKLATASNENKPLTYTQRQKLLADYQRNAKH